MRFLLAFFFFLIYAGDNLGLAMSLAPGMSLKNLLLYIVLTGIAINAAVARNRDIELKGVLVAFVVLILYAFVTWATLAFVVRDPGYAVKAGFVSLKSNLVDQFLTFLIFFYGLLRVKDAMWVLKAIIWIVMLGNVITIVDTMNIPDLGLLPPPRKAGRFEGFLGQPNEYGQFLALFLPVCIALFMKQKGKLKLLAGAGVVTSALAFILTGSRGAYTGLLAGAVLGSFYLRQYIGAQKIVRAGAAGALAVALIVVVTFVTGYAHLYLDRFAGLEGTAHVATSGRSSIWTNALQSMLENPLSFVSGYGFHAYESAREFRLATHNTYLGFLYDLGAVGVLLFITIFARMVAAAREALPRATDEQRAYFTALVFGLFAFMVATFFNDYHEMGYLVWAYAGVMMRIAMNLRADRPSLAEEAAVTEPGPVAAPPYPQTWTPRGARPR